MFDGVRSRCPLLLAPLSTDHVVQRIVRAIRTDQAMLVLPATLHLLPLLRAILPTAGVDLVVDALGANDSMDSFRGRRA